MKRNIKIVSIIVVLLLTFWILPLKVFASGGITPIGGEGDIIPIEGENDPLGDTGGGGGSTDPVVDDDVLAEDKVAEDKSLPDAGFDHRMIYIITALIVFAVFAYFKVVKYNLD